MSSIHDPDQYMNDLRQVLAQGRKRLGIFLGAGCPVSIRVDARGALSETGNPLIPDVAGLSRNVEADLDAGARAVVDALKRDMGGTPNIEQLLSRIRSFAETLGGNKVHNFDGVQFGALGESMCASIGKTVNVPLPGEANGFTELAGWIGGTIRTHAIEVFTPNYDLLLEEAFERAQIPYFDGFTGSREPFFDSATIANDDLPARWPRVWKIHGALGWDMNSRGEIIRCSGSKATRLIYPTHLKYDQTTKRPYSALIERMRKFLLQPDTLMLTIGFSFSDAHLTAVISEALAANKGAAVYAFQFGGLDKATQACDLAARSTNMSVYARDAAMINGIRAPWRVGDPPHREWGPIRDSFWGSRQAGESPCFLLGDFAKFAHYIAQTRADHAPVVEATGGAGIE